MGYVNLACVTDKVSVKNPCFDQSAVSHWMDDLGISLATSAKTADERYITGQNLVDQKVRIAFDDVMAHLTKNVTTECDLDVTNGTICSYSERIARAVWYRAGALIFKEISIDSKRYNEVIHYSANEGLAQMVYLDSSLAVFTTMENVKSGMYQKELERLEPIRAIIEQLCCSECIGSHWGITLP